MPLFAKSAKYRMDSDFSRVWVKSSLSYHNGTCVEVAGLDDAVIRLRDSKNPRGAVLSFTPAEWDAFIGGVYLGEFDRKRSDQ
jgi:Domain of unknown function (DUF397)